MEPTYEKTDDGKLSVVTTVQDVQMYSLDSLQQQVADAQANLDWEIKSHEEKLEELRAALADAQALLKKAADLGVQVTVQVTVQDEAPIEASDEQVSL